MAIRYKGTISKTNGNGDYGFIRRTSVRLMNGSPAELATRKDIFIHNSECDMPLCVGMEVAFGAVADKKREDGLRAVRARELSKESIMDGIEIHFDQPNIDHPSVPIRWCIGKEALEKMRKHPDNTWALVIVARPKRQEVHLDYFDRRDQTVVQSIHGIKQIGNANAYLSFRAPGVHDLVAYLLMSTDEPRNVWSRLNEARHNPKHIAIWVHDHDELNVEARYLEFASKTQDEIVAHCHMEVSVPADIFAKPLPAWLKAWLALFRLHRPRDECSMRGRLIFAFTIAPILFLMVEALMRTHMLAVGLLHFLFGGNPLQFWKAAISARPWGKIFGLFCSDDYAPMIRYKGFSNLLRPAIPIGLLVAVGTWIYFPKMHEEVLATLILCLIAVTVIGAIIGVLWILSLLGTIGKEKRELAKIERVETYATCYDGAPAKKAPTTAVLFFTGIKNKVCRSYA
jgi:hypothetical protein